MHTVNRLGLFRGEGFQAFCGVLLSADDPGFQAVDGRGGDLGNDGFTIAGDCLYQAYAPDLRRSSKVREKINDSVAKALDLRANAFPSLRRLVFLTPFDLTAEQHQHLRAAAQGAGMVAESWGESRLLAVLARHPQVKGEFPEILLPDIVEEIRRIRPGAPIPQPPPFPTIGVLQRSPEPPNASHTAYAYFKLYVSTPGLALPSIEPSDEEALLDAIRERFWEDGAAEIETRDDERVFIDHGRPELRFHRRWGRWTAGVLAMAATLPDLSRPGHYSAADMAMDVTRFLRLAAYFASQGSARVRFGYDPNTLTVDFEPSDVRARGKPGASLRGVRSVARPVLSQTVERTYDLEDCDLKALASDAHEIAAALIVPALKYFHLASVDTKSFSASIPGLIAASVDALAL